MNMYSQLRRTAVAAVLSLPLALPVSADDPTDYVSPSGVDNPARMETAEGMTTDDLIAAMKEGGLVVFIRHAETERNWADQVVAETDNCATQRVLSEDGWHQAKEIGNQFRKHGIPYGDVISSEYCRAWKTADLAFGKYEQNPDLNFVAAATYVPGQWQLMSDNMTKYLTVMPPEGTNTILVGHDDPFNAATMIYPDPMGSVWVVQPHEDGKFQVLGSIAPEDWPS
ncbi:MAG: histidine phosphatase family protein [Gammaproteobacteria bacterium]|nr:MAG: histidine phosphatase family protein [Gammaproteobacteria bacterium]